MYAIIRVYISAVDQYPLYLVLLCVTQHQMIWVSGAGRYPLY